MTNIATVIDSFLKDSSRFFNHVDEPLRLELQAQIAECIDLTDIKDIRVDYTISRVIDTVFEFKLAGFVFQINKPLRDAVEFETIITVSRLVKGELVTRRFQSASLIRKKDLSVFDMHSHTEWTGQIIKNKLVNELQIIN